MKRLGLLYALVACAMCLLFALTCCSDATNEKGGNEDTGTYYTITFDSQGGSAVEVQSVREGNLARSPETPTRETYSFFGWYKSTEENATVWDFEQDRVTSDITLYAKWQADEIQHITTNLTYERNGDGYTITGANGQEERIVIPAEHEGLPVTEIGESAFSYSRHTSAITFVSIPNTVVKIGLNAFHNRSELVMVDIDGGSSLASIGQNAFSGNHALKSIYIPQGVTEIGDSAFNNCAVIHFSVASGNTVYRSENGHLIQTDTQTLIRGANNANVPDGVKIIAQAAFRRANGISELNVPKSVESIGNYIIADSTIEKINYAGTETDWNNIEKERMWNMGKREIEISFAAQSNPENVKEVYMTFGEETITAQLYDNATARDLLSRLPLTLSFSDFNSTEKIAYLPNGSSNLDTSDAPNTFTPEAGDMTVYIPWGNIAIFYRSFSASSGLAPFGKIDSDGIAKLSQIANNTQITMTTEKPNKTDQSNEPRILITYFSCTNTTKAVAETIHNQISDSDIYRIIPAVPYTSADLNYSNSSCRANREQNDATARPKISGKVENIEQYSVIFLGYPIWWGQAPKIIYTFLESYDYDFDGVTIIPFCTSGSSGMGSSATNLHSLLPKATWKSGARISGNNVTSLIEQMN